MKVIIPLIWLFLIFIFLSIIFYLLPVLSNIGLEFRQSSILLSGSFAISIIVMLIFQRGLQADKKLNLTFTLAAISLKFLLYFILIISFFILSKNRSLEFILTFFVIYLSFTSFLMFSFIKLLKTK